MNPDPSKSPAPMDPPQPTEKPPPVHPLDYHTLYTPGETQPGRALGWIVLGAGILPAMCGPALSLGAARSGLPAVINSHQLIAGVLSSTGILCSVFAALVFVKRGDWAGILATTLVMLAQFGLLVCGMPI